MALEDFSIIKPPHFYAPEIGTGRGVCCYTMSNSNKYD